MTKNINYERWHFYGCVWTVCIRSVIEILKNYLGLRQEKCKHLHSNERLNKHENRHRFSAFLLLSLYGPRTLHSVLFSSDGVSERQRLKIPNWQSPIVKSNDWEYADFTNKSDTMRIECGQGLITELIIFRTIMETVLWLHDEAV